ncbi:Calx-beta domain-containing protein [Colwelliaceae bacterium 6441]
MKSIAILLTFMLSFPIFADDLFQWQTKKVDKNEMLSKSALSNVYNAGQNFTLNEKALNQYKIGDSFNLNLPNKENYLTKITQIKHKQNGIKHIIGKVHVNSEILPVIITLGKSQFFMRFVTPNNVWVAQGKEFSGRLIDEGLLKPKHGNNKSDAIIPPVEDILDKNRSSKKSAPNEELTINKRISNLVTSSTNQQVTSQGDNNEIANIDVLFVYSASAEALYDGDISPRINHIVAVTNQMYVDSNIHMTINIANTLKVDYPDVDFNTKALDEITDQMNSPFTELEEVRYINGVDMVVLLRPYVTGDDSCGIAWGNGSVNYTRMYSVSNIDCGDHVVAHELGHNMGLAHSRAQGDVGYSFPYALGYRLQDVDNGFATVMAYSVTNASKIYKFSNPDVLCNTLPCGINKDDPINGADASYALNQRRFQLQELADEEPDLTLTTDVINNITDENLKECINDFLLFKVNIKYSTHLKRLYCRNKKINNLKGLDGFKSLSTLELVDNNINDLSPLNGLLKLYKLDLDLNAIIDISPLSQLTNLTDISLGYNSIIDISSLSNLTNLNSLDLDSNAITDISPLSLLTNLTYLRLNYNSITDISSLSNLTNLNSLYFFNNTITDITPLSNLTNLNSLDLGINNIFDINKLSNLVNLQTLSLADNSINDISPLSTLTSLTYLKLANNAIANIAPLNNLNHLDYLNLSNNNVTNIESLSNNTKLKELYLGFNNFNDITPLENLKDLEKLELRVNPISNLVSLEKLIHLNFLDLAQTQITDISALGSLNSLKSLNLRSTDTNNLDALSSLYRLKYLDLGSTNVVDLSPILSLHNFWDSLNIIGNYDIYCWQIDYIKNFINYAYFGARLNCDVNDDLNDRDGDGINNINEITNNTNPLYHNEEPGLIEFQLSNLNSSEDVTTLEFNIVRTGGNKGEISVDLNSKENTAIQGLDYMGLSGTLTLNDGQLFTTTATDIFNDNHNDSGESFSFELSNPQGTALGNNDTLTVNLFDNDLIGIEWLLSFIVANENDGSIELTITRPEYAKGEMSVDIEPYIQASTAFENIDYELPQSSITFFEGEFSKTFTVNIIDNDIYEEDKNFYLKLTNPINATTVEYREFIFIGIREDETPVAGTIGFEESNYSVSEGDNELSINLIRNDGTYGDLTVEYTVNNDSATEGEDFTLANGSITFLSGEVEKTITITINDDDIDENNEKFLIVLSAQDSSIIGEIDETTINISDNDETIIVTPQPDANNDSSGGGGTFYQLILLLTFILYTKRYRALVSK